MPYATLNGSRFFYEDDDFVAPWLPHEVAFLQPWVMGDHHDWWSHVPVLGSRFRVLRLDRRGFGRSDPPPGRYEYTLDGLLRDFVDFLDALGVERVHYIGESFGAMLGAALAARYPDRVASLALCHSPTSFPTQIPSFSRDGFPDGPTAVSAMGGWAYAHSLWSQRERLANDDMSRMLERAYRAEQQARIPTHVQAAILHLSFSPEFDISGLLAQIRAPTLIIRPDHSSVITDAMHQQLVDGIAITEVIDAPRTPDGFTWMDPVGCARACLDFALRHSQQQVPLGATT